MEDCLRDLLNITAVRLKNAFDDGKDTFMASAEEKKNIDPPETAFEQMLMWAIAPFETKKVAQERLNTMIKCLRAVHAAEVRHRELDATFKLLQEIDCANPETLADSR